MNHIVANTMKSQRGNGGGGIGPEETLVTPIDLRQALRGNGATGVGTPGTGIGEAGDPSYGMGGVTPAVAFHMTQEPIHGEEFTPAIGRTSIGMGVNDSVGVRRLTPTECERLQALPDGWTRLDASTPDSRRYSALGDAVTASVAEFLGRRLLLVHEREPETAG